MYTPLSKTTLIPQCPLLVLVDPKATSAMTYVLRRATPKKQQPSSTIDWLRELSETDDDKDGLVFRKRKATSLSDETFVPQMKKVKSTPQVPPTQTHTNKQEKIGA